MSWRSKDNPADTPESPESAARHWFVRQQTEPLNAAERHAFEAWLAKSKLHVRAYENISQLWEDLGSAPPLVVFEPLGALTWRERLVASWRRLRQRWQPRPLLVGGLLAMGLAAVAGLYALAPIIAEQSVDQSVHRTAVAETRDVWLEDGSVVSLGARSAIKVVFEQHKRAVELLEGEAFFSVEKDPTRPFFVAAGATRVRVVGTRFNISIAPESTRVAVVEGIVEVRRTEPRDLRKEPVRTLTAGQQIVAAHDTDVSKVESVAAERPGAWREGRLVYTDAPLSEVVADANRYFEGTIQMRGNRIRQLRVTASFRTDEIDSLIQTVVRALDLSVEKLDGNQLVLRQKQARG